jgi:hypothetical protein
MDPRRAADRALLLAGNSLDKARAVFGAFTKKRPRARLTIRQRTRFLLLTFDYGVFENNAEFSDALADGRKR